MHRRLERVSALAVALGLAGCTSPSGSARPAPESSSNGGSSSAPDAPPRSPAEAPGVRAEPAPAAKDGAGLPAAPSPRDAGAARDAGAPASDAGAGRDAGLADAGAARDAGEAPPDPSLLRLAALSARLASLAERTVTFWLDRGPDAAFGGFHATLDRRGAAVAPDTKGLVQQARHLWMLSTWYERRAPSAELRALAEQHYDFFVRSFLDAADGAFVYAVSRDGARVVDARKQLFAESYALYALATYGRVFGAAEAIELALGRFASIDGSRHDAVFGGYDQRGDPGFKSPGAEKDANTHLHLLEAFTALYEASADARVAARLAELAELMTGTLRQSSDHIHSEFLLDWTPFGAASASYGHDLETAWLVLEAARVLGRSRDAELRAAALAIAERSAAAGFDAAQGGYFEAGVPGGAVTDVDKVWWVQFEALAGLWWAHALGGDPAQLERLERTLGWLEAGEDRPVGEWFAITNTDGSASGSDYKGDEWKASYHSVRALVFVQDWVDAERAAR